MITAAEFRDWLKTQVDSPSWTVGKLDMTQEQTICVYSGLSPFAAVLNVAGSAGSYKPVRFRILVRWTKNFTEAATKASEVYSVLGQSSHTIDGKSQHIVPIYSEAINLGTDAKGIYEHAIDIRVITQK